MGGSLNHEKGKFMKHEVDDIGAPAATRKRSDNKSRAGKPEPGKEEMQKKMEAASNPGPNHKALEVFVGEWEAEVKCFSDEGAQPNVSHGSSTFKWILNGHFLEEEFHGEMMGKAFVGRGLLGYDNVKQAFNMLWVSDVQTSMFVTEGKGTNNNQIITLEGTTSCAFSGRTDMPIKTVYRLSGKDKFTFEMYDTRKGKDNKSMEITYTRK
jgi:hypothetical protein